MNWICTRRRRSVHEKVSELVFRMFAWKCECCFGGLMAGIGGFIVDIEYCVEYLWDIEDGFSSI